VTLLTFIDRSNIALAAPALIADLGITRTQFGLASGLLMVPYGLLMLPSSLGFTLWGLRAWFPTIVFAWGAATAATGGVRSAADLYGTRLALGAAEAGCMPGCWFLLASFLPAGELPGAFAWVIAATVFSQVVGGPIAALFLGPLDGVGGLAGWRWLFIVEGVVTAALGLGLRWALADGPAVAPWLSSEEAAWLADRHAEDEAMSRGAQARSGGAGAGAVAAAPRPAAKRQSAKALLADALLVVRRWPVWLLACTLAAVQLAYFAIMFFMPLLIGSAFGASAVSAGAPLSSTHTAVVALKSVAVYGPAAVAVISAGALSRRTGDRRWTCVACLALSCVAFGVLPTVAAASPRGALATLALAASGGVACLAVLTTWPGDYVLTDPHAAASYAFFNAFAAVGGFAGPYLMGALPFGPACADRG